jgi:hypothetical protein
MQKSTRFNLIFVAVCAVIFLLGCFATAQVMILVIASYLNNCRAASMTPLCTATTSFISYWWLLFIPSTLLIALLANRIYVRLRERVVPEADSGRPQ